MAPMEDCRIDVLRPVMPCIIELVPEPRVAPKAELATPVLEKRALLEPTPRAPNMLEPDVDETFH